MNDRKDGGQGHEKETGSTLPLEAGDRRIFASSTVPNFRRFVSGQSISLIGSWTETVAQAVLVLRLTDSAKAVGLVTAVRYLPVLLLTPYAG